MLRQAQVGLSRFVDRPLFASGYNAVNNRLWEKRLGGLGDAYTYDLAQQLTGVQYDAGNPDAVPTSPVKVENFSYDAAGNRSVAIVNGGTTNYSVNSLNQYTTIGSDYPAYQDAGFPLIMNWNIYSFDTRNRFRQITSLSTYEYIGFLYDGLGRRIAKLDAISSTYYFYDGLNVIEEYDQSGNQIAAIAHGAGTDEYIFRWSAGYILCYYHQDGLGNVTKLTDASGVVVEQMSYDAFGSPTITDVYGFPRTTSFFGNNYLFTGREYIREFNLYDYRNRVYSPEIGRFLQFDPIGFSSSDTNLYRYVFNNPVNLYDPLGFDAKLVVHRDAGRDSPGTMYAFENGRYVGSTRVNKNGYFPGTHGLREGSYNILPKTNYQGKRGEYPPGQPSVTHPSYSDHPGKAGADYNATVRIHSEGSGAGPDSSACITLSSDWERFIWDLMNRNMDDGGTTLEIFFNGGAPSGNPCP